MINDNKKFLKKGFFCTQWYHMIPYCKKSSELSKMVLDFLIIFFHTLRFVILQKKNGMHEVVILFSRFQYTVCIKHNVI